MLKQKNIVMILPAGLDHVEFCSLLTKDNYTKLYYTEEEGFAFFESHYDIISAVILDIRLARQTDYRYVSKVCGDSRYTSIPIIMVSPYPPTEEDMICLELGAADLITPPCPKSLFSQRIYNAMRAKDSATYYEIEEALKMLPSNIYLKDAEGRYIFSTHYWDHLDKGDDPNWTIRGKTDPEVRKDKENARKAYESDRAIIASGKGDRYIIEEKEHGRTQFLELVKEPIFDVNGTVNGIIAQVNDVTELELLRRQVHGSV